MQIDVTCDDCGRDFKVNEASAGRSVRCKCGASVRVPKVDFDSDETPVRRPGKRKKKGDNTATTVIIIGVAVAGFIGLAGIVVVAAVVMGTRGNNLPGPPQIAQNSPPIVPTPPSVPTTPSTPSNPAFGHGNTAAPKTSPTTPTVPTTPAAPTVTPKPAAPPVAAVQTQWQPLEAVYQVAHPGKDAKIALSTGGKYVAVDREIYDMKSGEKLWSAPAAFGGGDKNALQAVSADGAVFVEGEESGQKITVYFKEKAAGEAKVDLPTIAGATKLTFLKFADPTRVVATFNAGNNNRVAIYNTEKPKKPLKEFAVEAFSDRTGAVSDDGKFLAIASFQALKVYDLAKGTSVATMAAPANGPQAFASCSGIAFSPENEELAAVLATGILVWSNRGKLLEEFGGAVTAAPFYKFNGLCYLPDKSGFFVSGTELFDRASKMVVWQMQAAPNYSDPAAVFDADHVIVSGGSANNGQVAAIKIPREELAKATKAIADKVDSVIAPGSPISIEYEVSDPRFASRQDVTNQLHTVLTTRLAQLGIGVSENQQNVLKVVYTEAPGETTEYVEGRGFGPPIPRSPFGSPFDKPGVKVVETKHAFTASLVRKNAPKVWWTTSITQGSPQSLKGDATETNVRNASFESIKSRIGWIDLPRFIPIDPSIPSLPLKSDLSGL